MFIIGMAAIEMVGLEGNGEEVEPILTAGQIGLVLIHGQDKTKSAPALCLIQHVMSHIPLQLKPQVMLPW